MLGKHTGHRRPGRSGIIDSGPEATSGGEAPEPSGAERLRRPMPEAVRQGVVEVAADLIGTLPAEEVPAPLRRFARFERRKRAKLAGQHIAAMLEKDAGFRRRVAGPLREAQADLAEAVEDGDVPPAADPVRVAVLGYLLRPAGWTGLVEAAREELERSATASEEEAAERRVAALKQELAAARAARGAELDKLRGELRETKAEVAELRRKLHEARTRFRAAEERADAVAAEAGRELAAARESTAASEKELRRLRARTAQAEAAAEAAKRAAREGRNVDDVRLRMLLDALVDAAQGVRRELALPSTIGRPADAVGGLEPDRPAHRALPGRALSDNDPQLLDRLLTLPQVHLVVDGYNVTKTGYGELPLSDQRSRLLSGLGGLAAQTRAEVTCVFDGAELDAPVAIAAPRGVRVLFSRPGQTADELIGELVRAEPPGRSVVVVSSDREVADAARRAEARPCPSSLLLRRLGRS
ncbi:MULTISPECIES: NYN domain-containing protein [Actinomadura]|uniref:YacP-like NYN domain-containing protein n=1 Tax=Actinomadura madurae TaxID=1993 RepID=A0A1I4X087_9ACTN|nr:NYN domain-containing protein [Actinomadura madurae]SFN18883.1 YacP-like NYN domain-containing protein [Actinomadura madurae]SPT62877.1 Predicted RNA-binding protein containing a PIN domain [Actinomadura madurae]